MGKDDDAKVKTAFTTLLTFVKNAATNPDEEKFRKIRLSNPKIQVRTSVSICTFKCKCSTIYGL